MVDVQHILVPTDFSRGSIAALDWAATIAERFGASVVLLHIVEVPAGLSESTLVRSEADGPMVPVGEYLRDTAIEQLQFAVRSLEARGVAARYLVQSGAPHREILHEVESADVDLVVMGTHGRTGLRHLLLGSTAERVIRQSSVPVTVVRVPEPDHLRVDQQDAVDQGVDPEGAV